jgi:hypothetical protein
MIFKPTIQKFRCFEEIYIGQKIKELFETKGISVSEIV